ncbi:hypothetical protein [Streptomyces sp. NPDC008137]|uniref:hypothetical protein n=1 Tax=Streptomyces sp. NPDC008137 TaxID=3364813 RepID=UPI0036E1072A
MPRSLAHSAGAAVVILAAALTSAAPVAAAAPSDGGKGQSSSCYTSNTQSQGLESIVWSVLFGSQSNTTQTRCNGDADGDGDEAKEEQQGARGFLQPFPAS